MTLSFDVFFDLRLNKRLSKQSRRRRFETSSCSLWHHCNGILVFVSAQDRMEIVESRYKANLSQYHSQKEPTLWIAREMEIRFDKLKFVREVNALRRAACDCKQHNRIVLQYVKREFIVCIEPTDMCNDVTNLTESGEIRQYLEWLSLEKCSVLSF